MGIETARALSHLSYLLLLFLSVFHFQPGHKSFTSLDLTIHTNVSPESSCLELNTCLERLSLNLYAVAIKSVGYCETRPLQTSADSGRIM